MVYVPVKLYSAVESTKALSFNMIRESDKCPIKYVRVCKNTGEEVPWSEIVKGYEYKKGDFVMLTDEDFEKAYPRKSKSIEIQDFVDKNEIDPSYFEKPYYLEPEKGAEKTYILLREALKKSNKVAVATFTIRKKESLAALLVKDNVLCLNQLYYEHEIRSPSKIDISDDKVSKKELEMAINLIEQMAAPWKPEKYKDTYDEELRKIIEAKIQQKPVEVDEEEPIPTEADALIEQLKASLAKMKTTKEEQEA